LPFHVNLYVLPFRTFWRQKRMQFLKDAVPIAKRVAVLWNPDNVINRLELEKATATAEALDLTALPVEIRVLEDIEGEMRRDLGPQTRT
jgi:ABC-type uncharacterized transport system substrate-binding protein